VNQTVAGSYPVGHPITSRDRAEELTCLQSSGARFDSLAGLQ